MRLLSNVWGRQIPHPQDCRPVMKAGEHTYISWRILDVVAPSRERGVERMGTDGINVSHSQPLFNK